MLDSSWGLYSKFEPEFQRAKAAKTRVITVVYDLLLLILPPDNFAEGERQGFEEWLKKAITLSDGLICISRAVAQDIRTYIAAQNFPTHLPTALPKIGYWHLGANFSDSPPSGKITAPITPPEGFSYLLMIGTLEPRKSHALALDAFEILWSRGIPLGLCIAGKEGWRMEEFMQHLQTHPRLQERLFFLQNPTDTELCTLYKQASGFLFLSKGEGFGLPLIEAAHYGLPLVCSDLPVFREIATTFAFYIELGDATSVADQLESWWKKQQAGKLPKSQDMPYLTWEESADALLDIMIKDNWMEG